jgi:hypothetical protein
MGRGNGWGCVKRWSAARHRMRKHVARDGGTAGDGARCGRGRDAARDVGATRHGMGCIVGMVVGARGGWSELTTRWRVRKFLRPGKLGQTPASKHYYKKLSLSTSKIVFYSKFLLGIEDDGSSTYLEVMGIIY